MKPNRSHGVNGALPAICIALAGGASRAGRTGRNWGAVPCGRRDLRVTNRRNQERCLAPVRFDDAGPNGARSSSPRLAPRAYLGFPSRPLPNPNGVGSPFERIVTPQPRWGCGFSSRRVPRVARSRNPGLYAAAPLGLTVGRHHTEHERTDLPLRRLPQPQREGQRGGAPAGGAVAAGGAAGCPSTLNLQPSTSQRPAEPGTLVQSPCGST